MKGEIMASHGEQVNYQAIIKEYAKTWEILPAYDEGRLGMPNQCEVFNLPLTYQSAIAAIHALKEDMLQRSQPIDTFGQELNGGLESILHNINQTFSGKPLYRSREERAVNLLYLIIKDRPFSDGNKRIGCLVFLIYLKSQGMGIDLNDNALIAIAILIKDSRPCHKEQMIKLIVNLLQ